MINILKLIFYVIKTISILKEINVNAVRNLKYKKNFIYLIKTNNTFLFQILLIKKTFIFISIHQ